MRYLMGHERERAAECFGKGKYADALDWLECCDDTPAELLGAVRRVAHADQPDPADVEKARRLVWRPQDEARSIMAGISQGVWFASWLCGIEYTLWAMVVGDEGPVVEGIPGCEHDLSEAVAELRKLAYQSGVWPTHKDNWKPGRDENWEEDVPLAEWHRQYEKRRKPKAASP